MEVLNASIAKPIRKKPSPLKSSKPLFIPNAKLLPRGLTLSLSTIATTFFTNNLAKSLTYEEALSQTQSIGGGDTAFLDEIINFVTQNPLIIGGAALTLFVPLALSQLLQKPKSFGVISAKNAYTRILEEPDTQLLDIREAKDFKLVGSPNIKESKKKGVAITYRGDDKQVFLKKLELKFKDPENTTLFILDKFDGNSELVAELATLNGFKTAFAIKDGAEGARGWLNSGIPWNEPKKTLSLDFSIITDAFSGVFDESTDGLPVTLGLAAATGLGVLAFSEIETVLQLLGSAAIIQFVTKKLIFAEDRKQTVQQLDEFLNTKVAPEELADEFKMIGKALLPSSSTKTLPAPVVSSPVETKTESPVEAVAPSPVEAVTSSPVVIKTESPVEVKTESPVEKAEVAVEEKTEPKIEKKTPVTKFLSPYPYYPDFKPPSSPSPSKP